MDAQTIRGSTRLVAILGNPVAHSLSPLIHNHAFARLGLPYAYVPLGTEREDLAAAVKIIRAADFAGANVTIPYKQEVMHLCDQVSDLGRLCGAVNTLYKKEGKLCADTTDGAGFLRALEAMGCSPAGTHMIVLGNGGTARSIGFFLAGHAQAPAMLTFAGRNYSRVESLAHEIGSKTGCHTDAVLLHSPEFSPRMQTAAVLVNTIPAGMPGKEEVHLVNAADLHPGITVYDVVYTPVQTSLVKLAQSRGCKAQSGLSMLLYQGLASFELWTGRQAPEELFDLQELAALSREQQV